MTNIIINGCLGKMGRVVNSCISARQDCKVIAGFDIAQDTYADFPVYTTPNDFVGKADVVIDFSHPNTIEGLLNWAVETNTAVVIATTGFSPEQIEFIKEKSKQIPIFFSFNMSLGVNLLVELAKKATEVLGSQFDIEIIEKHHNQKIDAPSGTAIMIADAINDTLDNSAHFVYDRHSVRQKREKNEIGIHAVRGGTIVGEHEVIFAGRDEVISLKHTANSKEIFAVGAVNAAVFLAGKEPGMYDMSDII